jgi:hypothetical protein
LEPLQIVDTINFANKFLHRILFVSPSHLYDLGSGHNAFAKVQKIIETETNFH